MCERSMSGFELSHRKFAFMTNWEGLWSAEFVFDFVKIKENGVRCVSWRLWGETQEQGKGINSKSRDITHYCRTVIPLEVPQVQEE